jgi:adenosyl cobinamide kinase/adenosyl cobinamide phosphate guanylyltransferase
MEAILPLQMASISFEVGKGIVPKSKSEKFEKHFMRRVVKALEKNCINVCDP